MVGFMHFQRSPRHLPVEELADLISAARGRIECAVVLVNPDNSCVAEIAALGPDWIQLHGPETPQRVRAIRAEAGVTILKAVPIGSAADTANIGAFADVADMLLLDAKPPKGADRPGGHGVTFDWDLLQGVDPGLQYLLSGGLTPETVGDAVRRVRPYGIDVSSGVETGPGEKSADLVRRFIENARAAAV